MESPSAWSWPTRRQMAAGTDELTLNSFACDAHLQGRDRIGESGSLNYCLGTIERGALFVMIRRVTWAEDAASSNSLRRSRGRLLVQSRWRSRCYGRRSLLLRDAEDRLQAALRQVPRSQVEVTTVRRRLLGVCEMRTWFLTPVGDGSLCAEALSRSTSYSTAPAQDDEGKAWAVRGNSSESQVNRRHIFLSNLTSNPRRAISPYRRTIAADEESPWYRHPPQEGGVGIGTSALS